MSRLSYHDTKSHRYADLINAPVVKKAKKLRRANNALHWNFTPLRSVKSSEL